MKYYSTCFYYASDFGWYRQCFLFLLRSNCMVPIFFFELLWFPFLEEGTLQLAMAITNLPCKWTFACARLPSRSVLHCFFRVSLSKRKAPRQCVFVAISGSQNFCEPLGCTVPGIQIDISFVPQFCFAFIDPVNYNILLGLRATPTSICSVILGSS